MRFTKHSAPVMLPTMTTQVDDEKIDPYKTIVYKRVPPDGGYGYVIVAAFTLFFLSTFVPNACFGFLYGPYLADRGDETSSVTTVSSLFNSIFHFTGIISNPLLQKYPQRTIGIIGAVMICSGNVGTIFITTVDHLVITYGIIQGLGMGFLIPAAMTSFNDYFALKKNLMMGIAQTIMAGSTILYPTFIRFLLNEYGFRGTVAIIAALNSHVLLTAVSLQPVKWHLKKVIEKEPEIENGKGNDVKNETVPDNHNSEEGQLLKKRFSLSNPESTERIRRTRPSVISVGSFTVPLDIRDGKKGGFWKSLDFSVLKEPVFYNLIVGVSMGLIAEYNFIAILPSYLSKLAYTKEDIAMVMTAYFSSDLVGRLVYTTWMSMVSIPNRIVFLGASIMCALVRAAFSFSSNYWWIITTTGGLGALRAFIHTPIPLSIAEEYSDRFTSAFTLYMVICGIIAYIVGHIMNGAKYLSGSDDVVMHVLTILYIIVFVSWSIELIYNRIKAIKPGLKPTNFNFQKWVTVVISYNVV